MNHGHVKPNPNGVVARCGGPTLCDVCAKELAAERKKEDYDRLERFREVVLQACRELGDSPLSCNLAFLSGYMLGHKLRPDDSEYEWLERAIDELPMTWVPAMLIKVAEAGYKKNVFKPGGASTIVANLETKLGVQNEIK